VRYISEKKGGGDLTWKNVQELNNFVAMSGITEIQIFGVNSL